MEENASYVHGASLNIPEPQVMQQQLDLVAVARGGHSIHLDRRLHGQVFLVTRGCRPRCRNLRGGVEL